MFVAIETLFYNIDVVVKQIGDTMQNASLSKDMFDFLQDPSETLEERCIGGTDAIRVEGLSFFYPAHDKPVLQDISFAVREGESIAIVGRNGSGKSTLVKILMGLYAPSQGKVIYGKSLKLSKTNFVNISAVFQDPQIYALSIRANIAISQYSRMDESEKTLEILHKVFDEKWLNQYSVGQETIIGRVFGGIELSGGERQRMSIGRAIFRDSTLVFMDEPTSALDPLMEESIYKQFLEINKGKTTFFITHRLATVRFADRILVLNNGKLIEEGSHAELMAAQNEYARMYELQKKAYVQY